MEFWRWKALEPKWEEGEDSRKENEPSKTRENELAHIGERIFYAETI